MRKPVVMAGGALIASAFIATPAATAQEAPPPDEEFQKVTLNDTPGESMDLAVLPDRRVLHTTRSGEVWLNEPDSGQNSLAAEIDVYEHDEEGLQSIAIDPDFDGKSNTWVYLYYSPPLDTPVDDPATPDVNEGDAPLVGTEEDFEPFDGLIRLSRFELDGDELDMSSEQQIIDVPVDRGVCCHVGGDIVFDDDGNLILATGDDTNPFESDGFAPIDERPDRNPALDAQRTSANTNDLRGKVLRIDVGEDGSYTVPEGNLFEPGTENTRPEVYAMGLRNPFRIEIDPHTDALYVADYSPDANSADPERGPAGTGKWTTVTEAGNYGWPYCATAELPYVDYDFGSGESGEEFDCTAPVNESPNNTGQTELPPVVQPDVWYSYEESPEFPELGDSGEAGGIAPMAGPSYDFDVRNTRGHAPVAWPEYYDGVPLFYEWSRDYTKAFHFDDDAPGTIEDVLPSFTFDNAMDMEFGPDGALYMLEYGDGYFAENEEAQLSRIDYIGEGGNHAPKPQVEADTTNGEAPLDVNFSSEGTSDADGDKLFYEWDFDGDGSVDSREQNPSFTYEENGRYLATLTVTDIGGKDRRKSAAADVEVVVGNEAPVVEFVTPSEGDTFSFGDAVAYEVKVSDDQEVDCSRVTVAYILGHDEHGHPQTTASGCSGTIQTTDPSGHDPETDNLYGVFNASYTDPGDGDLPELTGSDEIILDPVE